MKKASYFPVQLTDEQKQINSLIAELNNCKKALKFYGKHLIRKHDNTLKQLPCIDYDCGDLARHLTGQLKEPTPMILNILKNE